MGCLGLLLVAVGFEMLLPSSVSWMPVQRFVVAVFLKARSCQSWW